ncbi:MAG TPA: ABC transporter ATP-binding protein [Paludibacter sp.]
MDYIIELAGVKKSFKDVHAVKGVDLSIQPGEFVGLLGPNGAGKTTLVEMVEGLQQPDEGVIKIAGKTWKSNESELHQLIGLSLQETKFMDRLTVFETTQLFASFYKLGTNRVNEVIELVELKEKKKAYVNNLSGGQRQRLALGISLLNKPSILLLDEPTTGLDPHARRGIWTILKNLKEEKNTSLILTTHYMDEAEFLCDRIIIMDQGNILADNTLGNLLAKYNGARNLDELFINMTGRHLYD